MAFSKIFTKKSVSIIISNDQISNHKIDSGLYFKIVFVINEKKKQGQGYPGHLPQPGSY
jgi:hypothetical protein